MLPSAEILEPARIVTGQVQSPAPAFHAVHIDHELLGDLFDPFLLIDHFEMNGPFFAPHPHAGFSVSTYLLPDSDGRILNRDTVGEDLLIEPGGVLWAHTGAGLQHEENPAETGPRVHGVQTWVNLPVAAKHAAPLRVSFGPDQIPVLAWPGGTEIRLLAGALGAARGPEGPPNVTCYADVRMPPGAEATFDSALGENMFAFALEGAGRTGPKGADAALDAGQVAAFGRERGRIILRAGSGGLRLMLGSGRPLGIPIVQQGPFVASSRDELRGYIERYRSGEMGQLSG